MDGTPEGIQKKNSFFSTFKAGMFLKTKARKFTGSLSSG
jgi:hypothetical protein